MQRAIDLRIAQLKTEHGHATVEGAAVAAIRVDDQDFDAWGGMKLDEGGQLFGLAALVEDVAADDEVESA
jgi:hypothetical protein